MSAMDVDQPPSPPSQPLPIALTLRDKLLFAQAVHKVGAGPERWATVREMIVDSPLVETKKKKLFTDEACQTIYTDLMATAGFTNLNVLPDIAAPNAAQHLRLAQHFYVARMEELRGEIESEEKKFCTLVSEIEAIKSGDAAYMLLSIFSITTGTSPSTSPTTSSFPSASISLLDEVKSALVRNRKRTSSSKDTKDMEKGEEGWLPAGWTVSSQELAKMAGLKEKPKALPPPPAPKAVEEKKEKDKREDGPVVAPLQIQPRSRSGSGSTGLPHSASSTTSGPTTLSKVVGASAPPIASKVVVVPDDDEGSPAAVPGEKQGKDAAMLEVLGKGIPQSAKSSSLTGLTTSPTERSSTAGTVGGARTKVKGKGKASDEGSSPLTDGEAVEKEDAMDVDEMEQDEVILPDETDEEARQDILQDALAADTEVGEDVGLVGVNQDGSEMLREDNEDEEGKDADAMAVDQPSPEDVVVVDDADNAEPEAGREKDEDDDQSTRSELTPAPASIASDPSPPPMSPALPPAKINRPASPARAETPEPDEEGEEEEDAEPEPEPVVGRRHRESASSAPGKTRTATRASVSTPAQPPAPVVTATPTPATRRSSRRGGQAEDAPSPVPSTPGRSDHETVDEDREGSEAAGLTTRRGTKRRVGDRNKERTSSPGEPTTGRSVATRGSSRATPDLGTRSRADAKEGLEKIVEAREPPQKTRKLSTNRREAAKAHDDSDEEEEEQSEAENEHNEDGTAASRSHRDQDSDDDELSEAQTDAESKAQQAKEKAQLKSQRDRERREATKAKAVAKAAKAAARKKERDAEKEVEKVKDTREDQPAAVASSDAERPSPHKPSAAGSSSMGGDSPGKHQRESSIAGRATRAAQSGSATKKFKMMISTLHEEIERHTHGQVFTNAIRPTDARGYTEIVKKPMYLKLIKSRINRGEITTIDQYQRDLWLMFCNAMLFNKEGSEVFLMAQEMMLWCEQKISALRNIQLQVAG